MALGLSPEHLELAAAVRGWSQRHCPAEVVRAAADGTDGGAAQYRAELVPSLAEQGLFGLHLPADDGGQGFGLPELAVALEELGRALLPGAFLPTVLASAVLAEAAGTNTAAATGAGASVARAARPMAKLLSRLADGSLTGTVSLATGLTGVPGPDGGLDVSGESGPVLAGPMADLIIAGVSTPDGESWVVLDAADLDVTACSAVDLARPLARLRAEGIAVPADRVLGELDRTAVTSVAAILFGAEACGIADWAVHTATEHAKIRHQFGRPIGQFQAVKHRCARMLTGAEQAAAAVWDAARTPPGPDREFAAAVAAVVAVDAALDAANECIQTLGGIGYTWEHDAHLYYRRAMSLRALLGASWQWRERVATLAMGGAIRPVRVELPDGDAEFRAQVRAELRRDRQADRPGADRPAGRRRLGAAASAPALGPGRQAARAAGHRRRDAGGRCQGPLPRHRGLGGSRPDPVRHAGAAGALPACHAADGLPVVPAVQRTGRGLGPRRPGDAGRPGRRRLADQRPEDLDLAGQGGRVGHLHRANRSAARRGTMASAISSSIWPPRASTSGRCARSPETHRSIRSSLTTCSFRTTAWSAR